MRPDLDEWALDGAEWMSRRSKDPSHKVGAIVLRPDGTLAGGGYNGFPKHVCDDPALYADKATKRRRIQHAERNAVTFSRENMEGYTIYVVPLHPCSQCAGAIINSGIRRVVARITKGAAQSWQEDFAEAAELFDEAGVEVDIRSAPDINS
jgi:dCMP deaminase